MAATRDFLVMAALLAAPATPSWSVPTKADQPAQTQSARDADVEAAIRSLREMVFPPGERVENWDVGGADPAAEVRAMGADKYYVLETDASDGSSMLGILVDRPIADFAPPAWRAVEIFGSADAVLENGSLSFGHLSPRYVLAGRADFRRVRDVYCFDRIAHAILYEVPDAPASPGDEDLPDVVRAVVAATDGFTVCTRYDGDREKAYMVRDFLPDGRLLLNPDRTRPAARAVIVPAAPIDSLLKPPLPPAPATPPR